MTAALVKRVGKVFVEISGMGDRPPSFRSIRRGTPSAQAV